MTSCQQIETLDKIVFDNSQLPKISINSLDKNINEIYEAKIVDPYIDHSLKYSPIIRFKTWADNNIIFLGNENKFIINILNASLKREEIENQNSKKYQEKIIFLYEVHYLIEYILYDNFDNIIATTQVETIRSTTSGRFISLMQKENIINSLILESLMNISDKSNELIRIHMSEYIL